VEAYALQFLDILFFAAIAAFLVFRLWGVLGKRSGLDRRPPGSSWRLHGGGDEAGADAREKAPEEKVVRLPERGGNAKARPEGSAGQENGTAIAAAFAAMRKQDPSFDAEEFVAGARVAFEMVVDAFAKGDKATLQPLLSEDVYSRFAAAVDAREAKGEELETTIVGIKNATIEEASVKNRIAAITVQFRSDQIKLTRNKDGAVIEGDPSTVQSVTDRWTFERDLSSRNPNWVLVATHGPA